MPLCCLFLVALASTLVEQLWVSCQCGIPLPSWPTNDFTVHGIKVWHLPFSELHPSPDFVRLKVVLIPPDPPHTHTHSTHGTHAGVVGSCPWKPAWVGGHREHCVRGGQECEHSLQRPQKPECNRHEKGFICLEPSPCIKENGVTTMPKVMVTPLPLLLLSQP